MPDHPGVLASRLWVYAMDAFLCVPYDDGDDDGGVCDVDDDGDGDRDDDCGDNDMSG